MISKFTLTLFLCLSFCLLGSYGEAQTTIYKPPAVPGTSLKPTISSRSALAVDARTGTILYEKNSTFHQPAASMQKLLTALVIVGDGDLLQGVTITENDTQCEPSKVYIRAGERYTRIALLEALLVKSGNDCARALARDNAGSQADFARKMNTLARSLGAYNSNFINPNGLPAEGQFSCARDIAIIARAAYRNPVIKRITAMKTLDFERPGRGTVTYKNTNRLLRTFPACNGLKTGYTDLAGHCLASSGRSSLRDAIVVVMHGTKTSVITDSYKLLSWSLGI